uniref:Uncharacterized protein n=1 Tax=Amphimedon queenslandica TaxID=400682 RepID=A0A1X7VA51_AMPQE
MDSASKDEYCEHLWHGCCKWTFRKSPKVVFKDMKGVSKVKRFYYVLKCKTPRGGDCTVTGLHFHFLVKFDKNMYFDDFPCLYRVATKGSKTYRELYFKPCFKYTDRCVTESKEINYLETLGEINQIFDEDINTDSEDEVVEAKCKELKDQSETETKASSLREFFGVPKKPKKRRTVDQGEYAEFMKWKSSSKVRNPIEEFSD